MIGVTTKLAERNLFKHENYNSVKMVKFTPSFDNILFSTSIDGTIYMWDINSSKEPVQTYKAHTKTASAIAFSQNNSNLACSVGYDSKLVFHDIRKKW